MAIRIGTNMNLFRNTGSYGTPTWEAVTPIGDLTLTMAFDKANADNRGAGGIHQYEPTLLDLEIAFKILEDHNQADFLAIKAAFLARTMIEFAMSTGALVTTSGEHFIRFEAKIFQFNKAEPIADINSYDVTVSPCYSANAYSAGVNA